MLASSVANLKIEVEQRPAPTGTDKLCIGWWWKRVAARSFEGREGVFLGRRREKQGGGLGPGAGQELMEASSTVSSPQFPDQAALHGLPRYAPAKQLVQI